LAVARRTTVPITDDGVIGLFAGWRGLPEQADTL